MEVSWIIDRRITCVSETGDTITVFRILRSRHLIGQKRHRYVLSNGDRVVVVRDSKLRIAGTKTVLQPIRITH